MEHGINTRAWQLAMELLLRCGVGSQKRGLLGVADPRAHTRRTARCDSRLKAHAECWDRILVPKCAPESSTRPASGTEKDSVPSWNHTIFCVLQPRRGETMILGFGPCSYGIRSRLFAARLRSKLGGTAGRIRSQIRSPDQLDSVPMCQLFGPITLGQIAVKSRV